MTAIAATDTPAAPRLDIGAVFTRGWRLFVKDIGPLLIGSLIVAGLSILSLGILAGPLTAGLYGMVVGRVRDGRPAQVGDVFGQMHRFWSFFGGTLVLVLAIGIASVTIIGGVLLATIWLYVFPLMVDREIGFWQALGESKDLVVRNGFWEHLALVVILVVLGSVANGALALLATPFVIAALGAGYYQLTGRQDALATV